MIGPDALLPSRSQAPKPLRVLLCGLGRVGRGVYESLADECHRYELVGVLVRSKPKHVEAGVPDHLLLTDPTEAVERCLVENADVVIERLGGIDPAYQITFGALAANCTVITANKELVAKYWDAFAPYLFAATPKVRCSAAVGGVVPMMELVCRLKAAGQKIQTIRGVLNGTCNFILDQLGAGIPFDDAVLDAQSKGYAEPGLSADIDGTDAGRKLEILCRLGFGTPPAELNVMGIANLDTTLDTTSKPHGPVLRLVATVGSDRVARVAPEPVPESDFLSGARGAENRLEVITADDAVHRISGLGAGCYPTATAVLADLLDTSLAETATL